MKFCYITSFEQFIRCPISCPVPISFFSWLCFSLLVYETCKLGTHSPQCMGNEMEIDSGKNASSGFVLIDCPQSMKIDSSNASMLGSISDYFLALSNGWDLESYLKSLSKVLRNLKLSSCLTMNPKEGSTAPCTVSCGPLCLPFLFLFYFLLSLLLWFSLFFPLSRAVYHFFLIRGHFCTLDLLCQSKKKK